MVAQWLSVGQRACVRMVLADFAFDLTKMVVCPRLFHIK